jgi:hypothetical protein
MNLTIMPFAGLMPRISPKLLNNQNAQTATNCNFDSGQLSSSKAPLAAGIALQYGVQTIYWFNKNAGGGPYWLQFSGDVNVVRGPIANDTNLRTYFTGNGSPKYTTAALAQSGSGPYPGASRALGLPAPSSFVAAGPAGEPPGGTQKIATAYVVTFVSDMGEEGPPSPPTAIIDRWDGAAVSLSSIPVASGSFVISSKRIYRQELNGVYQFVAQISAAATTYSDSVKTESLGEPVPSETWVAPSTEMIGLTALPNGILMGWWKNTLAFSEPYQPHAWPIEYRLALDFDIVGAAVSASGVVVATTGKPYLISGSSPANMSQNPMDVVQACVAKRSVVDMGEFVIYASADGLVACGGLQAQLITEPHITPTQWRSMFNPATIHAYRWNDRYIGFYSGGSFSFHPSEGFRLFTDNCDCAFLDDESGDLYINQSSALKKWGRGSLSSYTWRSKVFTVPPSAVFAAAKVDADSYPVTFKFYSDGALRKTVSVSSKKPFRVPTQIRYRSCEIEVTGTATINSIQIANTMSEIM